MSKRHLAESRRGGRPTSRIDVTRRVLNLAGGSLPLIVLQIFKDEIIANPVVKGVISWVTRTGTIPNGPFTEGVVVALDLVILIIGFVGLKLLLDSAEQWGKKPKWQAAPGPSVGETSNPWGVGQTGQQNRKTFIDGLSKHCDSSMELVLRRRKLIPVVFQQRRPGDVAFLDDDPLACENDDPLAHEAHTKGQPPLPSTSITEMYDKERQLLVLGDRGAGRTTALYTLAQALLKEATSQEWLPVPVVFNLISWSSRPQPLADWMAEELYRGIDGESEAQLSLLLARELIASGQILPLLDGLEKVEPGYRAQCAAAIKEYLEAQRQTGKYVGRIALVVSSRIEGTWDTTDAPMQLHLLTLNAAGRLPRLSPAQVTQYLTEAGETATAIVSTLDRYGLWEIVTTFRRLDMLIKVCEDTASSAVPEGSEPQDRILQAFVRRMLEPRNETDGPVPGTGGHRLMEHDSAADSGWSKPERWLAWLAHTASDQPNGVVHLERMDSNWMPEGKWKNALPTYGLLFMLLVGFISGLAGTFIEDKAHTFAQHVLWGPVFGLLYGLAIGMAVGWSLRIQPSVPEVTAWSWRFAAVGLSAGLFLPPQAGLVVLAIFAVVVLLVYARLLQPHRESDTFPNVPVVPVGWLPPRLRQWEPLVLLGMLVVAGTLLVMIGEAILVLVGLAKPDMVFQLPLISDLNPYQGPVKVLISVLFRLVVGVAFAAVFGSVPSLLDSRERPPRTPALRKSNQSVWRSLLNSLVASMLAWVIAWLAILLKTPAQNSLPSAPPPYLFFVMGGASGLAFAAFGGLAVIRYTLLRLKLRAHGLAPFNCRPFLRYAVTHDLLKREGSGYRFSDEKLRDYFDRTYPKHIGMRLPATQAGGPPQKRDAAQSPQADGMEDRDEKPPVPVFASEERHSSQADVSRNPPPSA